MWEPSRQKPREPSHSTGPARSRAARPPWSMRGTPHAVMRRPSYGWVKKGGDGEERGKIGRRHRELHHCEKRPQNGT